MQIKRHRACPDGLAAPVSEEEQMEMNRAQLLADELGVPFLNLFDEATGIDFTTDCYDYLGHHETRTAQQS